MNLEQLKRRIITRADHGARATVAASNLHEATIDHAYLTGAADVLDDLGCHEEALLAVRGEWWILAATHFASGATFPVSELMSEMMGWEGRS